MNAIDYTYTKEDFDTVDPYEYLTGITNAFEFEREKKLLTEYAKSVGYKGFLTMLKAYKESLKDINSSLATFRPDGISAFEDQPFEFNTGEWNADESGVWRYGGNGVEVACSHPIFPCQQMRNVDTSEMKVKLAYRQSPDDRRPWSYILTDKKTVSDAKRIVDLATFGISITSGPRAQLLVDYIRDVTDLNRDIIPETKSIGHLGWNTEGFSPYVKGIVLDGADSFSSVNAAIHSHGDYNEWLVAAYNCRHYSMTARLVLASSFASALVSKLGCLPFFVHLWGMDSGTGKTVAQMLAASVWGDPSVGGPLLPTFKGTSVGFEVLAGFLHSIPLIMDELQLARDPHGKINFNVYELASGSGKIRSNVGRGLAPTPRWANCFITSGETPLVTESDGAGAVNRVIEIECKANKKVIEDGHYTAATLKANYGFAGQIFVEKLQVGNNLEGAQKLYEYYYEDCLTTNTTEKQAMAAALILTADCILSEWFFTGDDHLEATDIAEFLKSKEAVSAADRGYQYMCDWVAQNASHFRASDNGERYGEFGSGDDDGWVYIIRSTAWNKACQEAAISAPALLSHLKTRGLIQTRDVGCTKTKRIGGISSDCVIMRLMKAPDEWASGEPDGQYVPG